MYHLSLTSWAKAGYKFGDIWYVPPYNDTRLVISKESNYDEWKKKKKGKSISFPASGIKP